MEYLYIKTECKITSFKPKITLNLFLILQHYNLLTNKYWWANAIAKFRVCCFAAIAIY